MAAVVRTAEEFRKSLLAEQAEQMTRLAGRWRGVAGALEDQITALALHLDRLKRDGASPTQAMLYRMDRYKRLLHQARVEFAAYAKWAEGYIGDRRLRMGKAGLADAMELIRAAMKDGSKGTALLFDVLPAGAVEEMIASLEDAAPLGQLLRQILPDASDKLGQELINGIALGKNPYEVAKAMAKGFDIGLERTILIARTEQLRAYRESMRRQYTQSGVVLGYRRMCAKQPRTCIACIAADGTQYSLQQILPEHPMGRCAMIPLVRNMQHVQWENGRDWFAKQDEETQRSVMGGKRYDLWKSGDIALQDLYSVVQSQAWGPTLRGVPANDLA